MKVVRMITGASGPDWPCYVKTPDHINVVSADEIKSEYGSGQTPIAKGGVAKGMKGGNYMYGLPVNWWQNARNFFGGNFFVQLYAEN